MTYYSRQQSRQKRKQLNADLVRRIKANEEAAIIDLLDIFEQKIRWFATESFWDPCYGEVMVVNPDYADLVSERLVKAFRKIQLPGGMCGQQARGKSGKKGRRKV